MIINVTINDSYTIEILLNFIILIENIILLYNYNNI